MDSTIEKEVRRTNRNLLLTNLGLLILLALIGWAYSRYFYNFFNGPFPLSRTELFSIANPDSRQEYFVNIDADTIFESGFTHVEQTVDKYTNRVKSESVKGYYEILLIGKRLLIVLTENPSKSLHHAGALQSIPSDLQKDLVHSSELDMAEAFLPIMLDARSFRSSGYWGLLFFIPTLALVLWNLQKSIKRLNNPTQHPIYKQLNRYGDALETAGLIDNEFRSGERLVNLPKCTLTASWFVMPKTYTTHFIHLGHIIWVYKQRTKHSINFIPTGSTYKAVVVTRFGQQLEIDSAEIGVNSILESIYQRIPWIAVGYSDDLKAQWKRSPREFVAQIDQRYTEMTKQQ